MTNKPASPPPGVAPAELPDDLKPVARELAAFLRALPKLLEEGHEGRHALVKGDEVLSLWDTFEDGYQAGCERFGWGVQFLVQPIDPRFLSYPWPPGLLSGDTGATA